MDRKIHFQSDPVRRNFDDDDENVVETGIAVCQTCDGVTHPTVSDVDVDGGRNGDGGDGEVDVQRRQERRPFRAKEQREGDQGLI